MSVEEHREAGLGVSAASRRRLRNRRRRHRRRPRGPLGRRALPAHCGVGPRLVQLCHCPAWMSLPESGSTARGAAGRAGMLDGVVEPYAIAADLLLGELLDESLRHVHAQVRRRQRRGENARYRQGRHSPRAFDSGDDASSPPTDEPNTAKSSERPRRRSTTAHRARSLAPMRLSLCSLTDPARRQESSFLKVRQIGTGARLL